MTGPEHYRAAERVLANVDGRTLNADVYAASAAIAQAHATLALAAATAMAVVGELQAEETDAWVEAAGENTEGETS